MIIWQIFSKLSSQRCNELFWQCYRKLYFVSILSNWGNFAETYGIRGSAL